MQEPENLLFVQARGFSMWPFMDGKEKLVAKKVSLEELKAGDLLLYRLDSRLLCHRLVKKKNGLLFLRPDASFSLAEAISEADCLGKVIRIIKGKRIVNLEAKVYNFINRLILLFAPLLSLLARLYRRIF